MRTGQHALKTHVAATGPALSTDRSYRRHMLLALSVVHSGRPSAVIEDTMGAQQLADAQRGSIRRHNDILNHGRLHLPLRSRERPIFVERPTKMGPIGQAWPCQRWEVQTFRARKGVPVGREGGHKSRERGALAQAARAMNGQLAVAKACTQCHF